MLVGLGFVLALLASLVAARLIWLYRAGRRLRAARRVAPAGQAAREAERDQLRAENAMLQRKLEITRTNLKQQLAERMAQAARYRNRLDAAQLEITRLRLAQPLPPLNAASSPADDAAEARLRRRIDSLTELANRIEHQRTRLRRRSTDTDEDFDLGSAEAEAAELEGELQARIKNIQRKPKR